MKFLPFLLILALNSFAGTYYSDYATGNDASPGTQVAPWKRLPGMTGFTGKYSPANGDILLCKVGTTWPAICFPMTIVAGNATYGPWGTGKYIFDGEYKAARIITFNGCSNLVFDSLEGKHILAPTNYGYGILDGGFVSNILIKNCYLHGWRTSAKTDDAHGGAILTYSNPATGMDSVVIDNTEIENSENENNGVCVRSVGTIRNHSYIHDNSSGVLFCLVFQDSELAHINGLPFDGIYHANGIYMDPGATNLGSNGYIGRSFLHDVANGANLAYPNLRAGTTIVIEDSVLYGTMSAQLAIEAEPFQYQKEGPGNLTVRNCTIVNYAPDAPAVHIVDRSGAGQKINNLVLQNLRVIGSGTARVTDASITTCNSIVTTGNIVMTVADATAAGFTLANKYLPAGSVAVPPPVIVPSVVVPPVVVPPTNAKITLNIVTSNGIQIGTMTIDKLLLP